MPVVKVKDSISYFSYQIRPEARWDDDRPVTAKDVAFSLKLLHGPLLDNERWRAQYHFIKDIQLREDNPLAFTIVASGYTPEMDLLSGDFFILPAHKYDPKGSLQALPLSLVKSKYDSLSTSPTFQALSKEINHPKVARDTAWVRGSGPYQLTSWNNGQQIILSKKANWWGNKLATTHPSFVARPTQLQFQVIPDNAAAVLALKARQVDVMDNIPLTNFLEMQKDAEFKKHFNLSGAPTYDLVFLGMNGFSKTLQDMKTRQALAHLVNIPQLIKTVQGGLATPTAGLVHPSEKQFYNSALKPVGFDPAKAQALLKEAGWQKTSAGWVKDQTKSKSPLALNLMYRGGNSEFESIALLFQQNARAIGIPITLQAIESSQISQRLQEHTYDLYLRTFVGNPFSYNLLPLLHTGSTGEDGGNVTNFGNATTDQLLEKIAKEASPATKATLLKQLQKEMQEESNMVFLFFQQNKLVVSSRFDSVIVSSLKPGYDLPKFKLKKN
ncbi:ABC transporter substrate-binding protein [Nibribacter ruber]|uniref:ABC transporter substrate-binding protein n=1 Tax=Nibribacter ruber TaxID=2698458 RepID=A0A6P1NUB8_9BACT|nr:ABC transporter substrate-binding protein [Nibribacter ruber]